ncbi:MAG: hypothetical protein CMP59_11975 [Flavobacteriales bacterium]|nr:hypothetical protein [Flavobacteriales bacterium]
MIRKIALVAIIASFFAACAPYNPSIMFKTDRGYEYDEIVRDSINEWKIAPNDIISFRLFTNNGFRLIDVTNENLQQMRMLNEGINYTVEYDGIVNLPIIGRVDIAGKTLREAELFLEELYEEVYIDPFIMLNVTNRRVTIFPGNGGNGMVITLQNNNVTLLEALALAGGLREDGRANRITLIRGDLADPMIHHIDLSHIEGISQGNIILQAGDIIYVEPLGTTVRQVARELAPVLTFVTTLITLYVVINGL